jgi:RND family efflux transporter MFP subunit
VANPLTQEVTEWAEYTGRLEAVETVEVRPRVDGYINSINFTEGQKVKAGDLLAVIDPRPFQAQVNRLEAQVTQAEAALQLADANLKRAIRLIENKAISQEEADIRKSESLQASADVAAAEAELAAAQLDLDFTRVIAPIDGIADRHIVSAGNLVNNSTVLTTIVPHSPIYAYFEVDERSFLRDIRRHQGDAKAGNKTNLNALAEMGLDDEPGFPHMGLIDFTSNRLNPNTATITLRALFENADEFLTPGLFARVRIPLGDAKQSVLIPDAAISSDQSLKYVWVLGKDNMPERRTIELGPKFQGLRIVRSGLSADEQIVINGIQYVRAGAPVTPQEAEVALASL